MKVKTLKPLEDRILTRLVDRVNYKFSNILKTL